MSKAENQEEGRRAYDVLLFSSKSFELSKVNLSTS